MAPILTAAEQTQKAPINRLSIIEAVDFLVMEPGSDVDSIGDDGSVVGVDSIGGDGSVVGVGSSVEVGSTVGIGSTSSEDGKTLLIHSIEMS